MANNTPENKQSESVPESKTKQAKINKNLHPELLRLEGDNTCVSEDIEQLCCMVQNKTIETINWYIEKKKYPKIFSRLIRMFAIFFAVIGGLAPILNPVLAPFFGKSTEIMEYSQLIGSWGYVALALSGALILTDKLFGFSSSWMRFITTQLHLQQALAEFQMDWAIIKKQKIPDAEEVQLLECLKKFRMDVWTIVENETQAWMTEFQNTMMLVEKRAQAGEKKIPTTNPPPKN